MKVRHLLLLTCLVLMAACKEEVDTSARYVFKDYTVFSYLEKFPQYSEYATLLGEVKASSITQTTLKQLLSARGHYTCFAPTNEAIQGYLEHLVEDGLISEPSWDAFPDDHLRDSVKKVIVYNSIIDGADENYILTSSFPETNNAELPLANMNDRKLTVRYGETPDSLYVNYDCAVDERNKDIEVTNGVIHAVHKVIYMQDLSMTQLLSDIIVKKKEGFMVAAKVILACGLQDTMSKIRDEVYEHLYLTKAITDFDATKISWTFHGASGHKTAYLPEHRKYGFTVFAERDAFWREAIGKEPIDITPADVQKWVLDNHQYAEEDKFTTNENYTSPDNLLNQWITYHILPCKITSDKLVLHNNEKGYNIQNKNLTIAQDEFWATMGKRRLLKIFESRESEGVFLNRFPNIQNGRRENYHESSCDASKVGHFVDKDNANVEATNGIIYPIKGLLLYDEETRNNLQRQRLRWDVSSLFPEFMNNDIRGQTVTTKENMTVGIPSDDVYKYFDDMEIVHGSQFYYLLGRGKGWHNYLGDEFNVIGRYELVMRLPPVPKRGTYEFRIANSVGGPWRSMCQVYWGTDKDHLTAMGTPLDFRLNGLYHYTNAGTFTSPVGWVQDSDDDDYNAEIDKTMRNKGFMKGAQIYCAGGPGVAESARQHYYLTRRVMLTAVMDPDVSYYIRLKNVLDQDEKQLYMDYIELVSKEVYDNPNTPEDIW